LATASLTLPDGTKVNIEGTADEVANLLAKFSQPAPPSRVSTAGEESARRPRRGKPSGTKTKSGPVGNVLRLRDEGFFKTRRSLPDIQRKLEEDGHIYAQSSLSPTLIRLTRKRELRRIKDKKGWVYVNA
jgi:hypothetical protein